MAFPCPLFLTSMHFAMQWLLSHVACMLYPMSLGTERVSRMSWKEWATISIPCGLVTALDVGLSNLSLVTITITFYTMVKSSTPVFVLGWAYLFGIERITWRLVGVIVVIALGEFLTVAGEVDFVLHGFLMCLTASVLSGARWTLVQLKLQSLDPPLKSTIVTMKLLAPSMFFGMLLISLVVEHPWNKLASTQGTLDDVVRAFGLGMAGGILAISMVLCEFSLILNATAIIMMIGGVMKEIVTIFIGITFFGDKLNAINISGCTMVFSGVILYKLVFHLDKAEKMALHEKNMKDNVGSKLMHESRSGDDDDDDDDDEVDYVPIRAVELVDRNSGKLHQSGRNTVEDQEDETGYVMPTVKLV